MRKFLQVLIISSLVIILDQTTKYLVSNSISPMESVKIFSFLRIVHVWNTGAAFGMFENLNNNFFMLITIVAVIIISWLLIKSNYSLFGLSLVLGGAIGNLIDRLRFGKVFDFIFIKISVAGHYWPAFNIADSSLTIGLSLILFIELTKKN